MEKGTKYKLFLLTVFILVWIWAAIDPIFPHDWLLENYLVFLFVPIIILTGFYFKLSNLSYTLITIFMIMHVFGSHYTYVEVPFGYTLQEWLGSDRNMYDRLVHFAFGLLLAYPLREMFVRVTRSKGFWGLWFPLEITLAFSCVYELIEWGAAVVVDPAAGLAFLGSQGDVWDAQKDMALAGLGALITMTITFVTVLILNNKFWQEFKQSLMPSRHDAPLGEESIERFIHRKN